MNQRGPSLLVKGLCIPAFTNVQWRVNENFDESLPYPGSYCVTGFEIGRNGRHKHDDAVALEQFSNESDPADIFVPVVSAKIEAATKMAPYYVAVELFRSIPSQCNFSQTALLKVVLPAELRP